MVPEIDLEQCKPGRVLSVHGLLCVVEAEDGTLFHCTTRRILRTLSTEQRHVLAAGDRVLFRHGASFLGSAKVVDADASLPEGLIERIEPRRTVISRTVRGQQHVIVANVDQMVVVSSAAEPRLKPALIDRYVVTA